MLHRLLQQHHRFQIRWNPLFNQQDNLNFYILRDIGPVYLHSRFLCHLTRLQHSWYVSQYVSQFFVFFVAYLTSSLAISIIIMSKRVIKCDAVHCRTVTVIKLSYIIKSNNMKLAINGLQIPDSVHGEWRGWQHFLEKSLPLHSYP